MEYIKIRHIKYIFEFLIIISGLILHLCSSYSKIIKESYQNLETYNVKTINTEYGIMSYIDEGSGETIIISHGIFGGYDQGYKNLYIAFSERIIEEYQFQGLAILAQIYPKSQLLKTKQKYF
jgi:phage replication-related protein YjqB (UPF0714/DUF867 family)